MKIKGLLLGMLACAAMVAGHCGKQQWRTTGEGKGQPFISD